jgi:hypothetical protein
VLVILICLFPVYQSCGTDYGFYIQNILCIAIALTFTRFIFLLDYHWFAELNPVKVFLTFAVVPILLYIVDAHYEFQRFTDEDGIQSLFKNDEAMSLAKYIHNQFVFFWAWAFLACLALPVKMIRSIWKDYKGKMRN